MVTASAGSDPLVFAGGAVPKPIECDIEFVRLQPVEMRFVTGIARTYDDTFPLELSHLITREDFETAINQINNTLRDYWPCVLCICWGYLCCPCTLGTSLLCPNLCIKDAEQYVRALMGRINKRLCFACVGVEWRLIEITYPVASKASDSSLATSSYQSPLEDAIARASVRTASSSSSTSSALASRPDAKSPLVAPEV